MDPPTIFAVLLIGLVIDWMSVGPDSLRDRVAFLLGLPAIYAGWNGSPIDTYTVGFISAWINGVKNTGNEKLAAVATGQVLAVLVGVLAFYCIGVLLPARLSSKLGNFATLTFVGGGASGGGASPRAPGAKANKFRLNGRLWACAFLLGIMADLPGGMIGDFIRGTISGLTTIVAPLPNAIFGVG